MGIGTLKMTIMKKRILMLQPTIRPAGDNVVFLWMVEALKKNYDITLLTWRSIDFSSINRFYGTGLSPTDIKVCTVPALLRSLIECIPDPWNFQKNSTLMQWCKFINRSYDIVISAYSECDFGTKGIQYVHYPFHRNHWLEEPEQCSDKFGMSYLYALLKTRMRPWRVISGFSFERMKQNLTLVNSDWTGRFYHETYGVRAKTVYPPIPGVFPEIPWSEKEDGFVCIGRFAKDKRIDNIIDILSVVRLQYQNIHLHLIGIRWESEASYYKELLEKVKKNSSWVHIHENLSREELIQLACKQRYGIHGKLEEHFGIAVAEMLRCGCIPFISNDGGQVEIVGNQTVLRYHSDKDAVEKILQVLNNHRKQLAIHESLRKRKALFTTKKFMDCIEKIVKDFTVHGQS